MTSRALFAIIALLTLGFFVGSSLEADAARFGGGRSFGGSSSFSRPFSAPKGTPGMQAPSATRQQPGAAAAAAPGRGFGMMGGILGGVLAGTLLGSLLSGNGFGGGGMLDILLIGLALYLLFKFLGRRRAASQATGQTHTGMSMPIPGANDARDTTVQYSGNQSQKSGMDWGSLTGAGSAPSAPIAAPEGVSVPAGFDVEEFLRGAKMAYERLNNAWDKRELDDIAHFSTQPFFAEITRQAAESPEPENTEIMLVNANLLGVVSEAGRENASVFFDVLLREQPSQSAPLQVREVWHFVRAAQSSDSWKLDGIQQVEDAK